MEVTVSKMFSVVVAVIVLTGSSHAGYIYPRPNNAFELPKKTPYIRQELEKKTINEDIVLKTHESVVSYSVPFEDFNYLHQIKTGHQPSAKIIANAHAPRVTVNVPAISTSAVNNLATSRPYVNIPTVPNANIPVGSLPLNNIHTPSSSLNVPVSINNQYSFSENLQHHNNIPSVNVSPTQIPATIQEESQLLVNREPFVDVSNVNLKGISIPTSITPQNHLAVNTYPQITIHTENKIPAVNIHSPIEQHRNLEFNTVQHLNVPAFSISSENSPVLVQQNSNLELNTEQHLFKHEVNDDSVNIQNIVTPKITKHIYFHAPPPEIEEPVVHTSIITPKKKIYKIIFIKVPSQTTKNYAQLQGNVNNFAPPIEEKTIIYVLSKKPETPVPLLPKPAPSEHEVLFVKYSGNAGTAAEQVTDTLEQSNPELLSTSRLLPGLINGKR